MKKLQGWMTVTEACKKFGWSRTYVHILLYQDRIPDARYIGDPTTRPMFMIPAKTKKSDILPPKTRRG